MATRRASKDGYAYIPVKEAKIQYQVGTRFFASKAMAMNYARKKGSKRIKKITYY